jgi:hypothetical protein
MEDVQAKGEAFSHKKNIQHLNFFTFFLFLCVICVLLGLDPDQENKNKCGSGFKTLTQTAIPTEQILMFMFVRAELKSLYGGLRIKKYLIGQKSLKV